MGQELPALTKFLVNMTNFFGQFWWLILIIVVALSASSYFFVKRTSTGRRVMDSFKLHVPMFGGLSANSTSRASPAPPK